MKSSKQTLAESSFTLILSTALVKIISAFFKIPLASDSFLGEIGFGYFSVAHDLYMPFYTLAISGLPVAVSHIIAEKISQNRKNDAYNAFVSCRKLFLICGIAFSLLSALLAIPITFIANGSNDAAYSVIAVVPSVFLCFVISVYRGYFEGFSDMRPTAVSKLIEALSKLVLGLIFSYLVLKYTKNVAYSAASAMLAVTLGTLFSTIYLLIKHKHSNYVEFPVIKNTEAEDNPSFNSLLKIATPFALASLSASIVAVLDIFTVKMPIDAASSDYISVIVSQNSGITGDVSTYLYGVRSKAFTIYYLIPTFTAALGVGALPVLTSLWAQNEKKALLQNVNYTLKLICFVTFPAAIGMLALSDRIMPLLYSDSLALDGNLLRLYSIAGLFSGIAIPLTTVLQSIGMHKRSVINIAIGTIIKIIVSLSLVFIPQINIYAAPIGTLACYVYIAVSVLVGIGKTVGNIYWLTCIIKPLICAIMCGLAAFFMAKISDQAFVTAVVILVGILVYFGFVLISKIFTNSELKAFPLVNRLFSSKK